MGGIKEDRRGKSNNLILVSIMDNIIKIGIIGIGGYGEKLAKALSKVKNAAISACFHPDPEKAKIFAATVNCRPYNKLESMLVDSDIQAVVIATPNHLHYEEIKLAIKYKKHIFVEKPITNSLEEAKEIINECEKDNLILMVGHNFRRGNAIRKMKAALHEGKIGNFVSAEMNLSHSGGMKLTSERWRFYEDKCPGGSLMMLGIHAADTSNYLFGQALGVAARIKRQYSPAKVPDTALLLLELENGGVAYICSNYNIPATNFIKIYGTNGVLEYDYYAKALILRGMDNLGKTPPPEVISYEDNDTIFEEMEEFVNCMQNNSQPETGGKEAYEALAIVSAALESQKNNTFSIINRL